MCTWLKWLTELSFNCMMDRLVYLYTSNSFPAPPVSKSKKKKRGGGRGREISEI